MEQKNSKGQGTIEYLVILAIVIIISLIVVYVVSSQASSAQGISQASGKLGSGTSVISIYDAVVDSDGNAVISLGNNTGDSLSVYRVNIGGQDTNYSSTTMPLLDKKTFGISNVGSSCNCVGATGQKRNCDITIYTISASGIEKQYRSTIVVDCVNDATANNGTVEPDTNIPSPPSTPIHLCGEISTPVGYTEVSTCQELSSGNYILTANLTDATCLTITEDNVNINGNYCTVTGNISGATTTLSSPGYDFNLSNIIVIGNVDSTGLNGPSGGGNGGAIILVDSNVVGDVNSIASGASTGGDGGEIILINTTVSGGVHSVGDAGGTVANGGNITLTNSTVRNVISTGWNLGDGCGTGCNGGAVSLVNSVASNMVSTTPLGGGMGGASGAVTLTNSSTTYIYASANYASGANGQNGGRVILVDSNAVYLYSNGGNAETASYTAGNGGTIDLNNVFGLVIVSSTGGNAYLSFPPGGTAGNGGIVSFNPCPTAHADVNVTFGIAYVNGTVGTINPSGCHN